MSFYKNFFGVVFLTTVSLVAVAKQDAASEIESFVKRDLFGTTRISPTGEFLAVTIPMEDRTSLVLIRRSDMSRTGHVTLPKGTHIRSFSWVNPERVLFSIEEKSGELEQPVGTGELFGVNADGSGQGPALVGVRSQGKGSRLVAANIVDTLRDEDDYVLVAVSDSTGFTQVDRMHVNTGRRTTVGKVPVRRATFLTDPQANVRFATGFDAENKSRTYYRKNNSAVWDLINDEKETGVALSGVGFHADGKVAYLQSEEKTGPDSVYEFDGQTREKKLLVRDENVDPSGYLASPVDGGVYGVIYSDGVPRVEYVDADNPFARQLRSLQAGLPDQMVIPASYSDDGHLAVYLAYSDRVPGDFYLFDREAQKATFLLAKNSWMKQENLQEVKPVSFRSRDGLLIHGFLTTAKGTQGKPVPLVVNPHGGPFGVSDSWGYNPDAQLLASHGYSVLQVNFRGSGNHGRSFLRAGYQQWGGAMQDDLTDATKWAIETGIADPNRICIYGASYGAYASLMGVVKEPDLYRCAVGNVGVYDMAAMYKSGDIPESLSGRNFLEDALGKQDLAAISPNHQASKIKVPVLLAAGREDRRAPPVHTEMMSAALKKSGIPVETVIYEGEGHGNYLIENRVDFYNRLLTFLNQNIGGGSLVK